MKTLSLKRFSLTLLLVLVAFIALQTKDKFANDLESDEVFDGVLSTENFNNLAEFDHFDITAYDGSIYGPSLELGESLIPRQQYKIQLTILDQDTIADLESLEIRLWNSSDSNLYENLNEVGTNGKTFVVKWTAITNTFTLVTQEGITSADMSWELIGFHVPLESDLTEKSFTFEVEFIISKVAPRSTLTEWHVGAKIEDGRVSVEEAEKINVITETEVTKLSQDLSLENGFNMAFYGEVILPEQSQFVWEGANAGTRFSDNISDSISNIVFISNDTYESQIKSSEIWDAVLTQEIIDSMLITPTDLAALLIILETDSLLGITFDEFNMAILGSILLVDTIYLPGVEGENLTGATLTSNTSLLDSGKQLFSIGFVNDTTAEELTYMNVLTTFTGFGSDSETKKDQTNEAGEAVMLTLTLALSDFFQNARYEGYFTIQITNTSPLIDE